MSLCNDVRKHLDEIMPQDETADRKAFIEALSSIIKTYGKAKGIMYENTRTDEIEILYKDQPIYITLT
jgi:hypothetical protein